MHATEEGHHLADEEVVAGGVDLVRVHGRELVCRHARLGGDAVAGVPGDDGVVASAVLLLGMHYGMAMAVSTLEFYPSRAELTVHSDGSEDESEGRLGEHGELRTGVVKIEDEVKTLQARDEWSSEDAPSCCGVF